VSISDLFRAHKNVTVALKRHSNAMKITQKRQLLDVRAHNEKIASAGIVLNCLLRREFFGAPQIRLSQEVIP
jgi:hypothetical protein